MGREQPERETCPDCGAPVATKLDYGNVRAEKTLCWKHIGADIGECDPRTISRLKSALAAERERAERAEQRYSIMRRAAARKIALLTEQKEYATDDRIAELQAELDRVRPVVTAARMWRHARQNTPEYERALMGLVVAACVFRHWSTLPAEQSTPVDPSKVAAGITEAWRATASDAPLCAECGGAGRKEKHVEFCGAVLVRCKSCDGLGRIPSAGAEP